MSQPFKTCPTCGRSVDVQMLVCPSCGYTFSSGYPAPPPQSAMYPQYAPVPQSIPEANSKKMAAGLCGIFLGAFGVHKFILGQTNAGIIMLVTAILGGIVTCGIATSVISIIGLIEGIMYLTKSDQEFYQTYMVQGKAWF